MFRTVGIHQFLFSTLICFWDFSLRISEYEINKEPIIHTSPPFLAKDRQTNTTRFLEAPFDRMRHAIGELKNLQCLSNNMDFVKFFEDWTKIINLRDLATFNASFFEVF